MDQTKQPGIQVDQVVLVEARFAHGRNALVLPPTTRIAELNFNVEFKVGGKPGEKSAIVGVRASTPEDPDALYSVSVEVAMIVTAIPGQENLDPFEYAQQMGPAALFPFVREAVASLTMKGRFGALWLKPYNLVAGLPTSSGTTPAIDQGA